MFCGCKYRHVFIITIFFITIQFIRFNYVS